MKKFWTCLVAAILVVAMCFSFTACAGDTLIVQTNAFFAPFEYYDGDEIVGVDVEIMEKVGKKLGKDVEFKNGDFGQIIDIINEGKMADVGAAGITITDARKEKVDFSIPYYTSVQYVIWKTADNTVTTSKNNANEDVVLWSQLKGKDMGVQRDTTGNIYVDIEINGDGPDYPGELAGSGATCTPYDDALIAATAIGVNVDCVVVDELPAQFIVENNSTLSCAPLYYDAETATEEQYAMCVTKGNKELLDAINEVLEDMIDNGEIEALVKQHLGLND